MTVAPQLPRCGECPPSSKGLDRSKGQIPRAGIPELGEPVSPSPDSKIRPGPDTDEDDSTALLAPQARKHGTEVRLSAALDAPERAVNERQNRSTFGVSRGCGDRTQAVHQRGGRVKRRLSALEQIQADRRGPTYIAADVSLHADRVRDELHDSIGARHVHLARPLRCEQRLE